MSIEEAKLIDATEPRRWTQQKERRLKQLELENRNLRERMEMLEKSLCAKVLDAGNKILLSPKLPTIKSIPIYFQCCGILVVLQQK